MPLSWYTVLLILPSDSSCWFLLSCYCDPVYLYKSNSYLALHCEANSNCWAQTCILASEIWSCSLLFDLSVLPHTTSISSGFALFGVAIAEGKCRYMYSSVCTHSLLSRNPRRAYRCTVGSQQENRVESVRATISTDAPRHPTPSLLKHIPLAYRCKLFGRHISAPKVNRYCTMRVAPPKVLN